MPVIVANQVMGVLDVDSPKVERFDHQDRELFEGVVKVLVNSTQDWEGFGLGAVPA